MRPLQTHRKSLLKTTIAVLIVWALLHSGLLDVRLLARLLVLEPSLLAALLVTLLLVGASGIRWWLLLRVARLQLSARSTFAIHYIAFGLSQFLPSGVGGDVAKIAFIMKHAQQQKTAGITSILADRAMGLASMMLVVVITCGVYHTALPQHSAVGLLLSASMIGVVAVSIVAVLAMLWPFLGQKKTALFTSLLPQGRLGHGLKRLFEVLQLYRSAPATMLLALGVSLVVQLLVAVALWLLGMHMGLELAFWQVLLASSLAQVASLVPLTPGGIGVGEAAFGAALSLLAGADIAGTASVMLAFRVLCVLVSLPAFIAYSRK